MQWLFTGTFVGMAVVVPIYGWAAGRLGRRMLVPLVQVGLAMSLVGCFAVARIASANLRCAGWHAAFVFVWLSVFNMLSLSAFWSLMGDRERAGCCARAIVTGASCARLGAPR